MTAATITAIMPAFDGGSMLRRTLGALAAMLRAGGIDEVILADDGSEDDTAAIARELGCRVVASGGRRRGPGQARNAGAAVATGDILWFVDADVVAHETGPALIRHALAEPGVVAVFGSYDDRPPARGFVSQYKNLVHHHYHQIGRREAATFWAGCGAVRRNAFLEAGGFDVARFPEPSIEDVELGYRLRARGGRIVLHPQLNGTHLKVWTLRSLIHTDIFKRAVPWSRLLLGGEGPQDDLNVGLGEKIRSLIACLVAAALGGAVIGMVPLSMPAAALAVAAAANIDLLVRLARANGWAFGLAALLLHQVYYLYSVAVYAWCWAEARLAPARKQVVPS